MCKGRFSPSQRNRIRLIRCPSHSSSAFESADRLDPRPIPIEVHHASFAALPKLTLQAGLANAMPGASTFCDDPPLATASPTTDRGSKIQKRDKIKKRLDLRIRTDS